MKSICFVTQVVCTYVQQRQSTYNGVITSTYCMQQVIGMYYRKNERRYHKNQKKED